MQFTAPYALVGDGANLALHLHPDHLADLRASGLGDETIRAAGVYSLRPCDFALFFSARKGVPSEVRTALCFPYQGICAHQALSRIGQNEICATAQNWRTALHALARAGWRNHRDRRREKDTGGASGRHERCWNRRALELDDQR